MKPLIDELKPALAALGGEALFVLRREMIEIARDPNATLANHYAEIMIILIDEISRIRLAVEEAVTADAILAPQEGSE